MLIPPNGLYIYNILYNIYIIIIILYNNYLYFIFSCTKLKTENCKIVHTWLPYYVLRNSTCRRAKIGGGQGLYLDYR